MSHKIETRNLEDLSIHPALKTQPRLLDDELISWRKGMKRRGEAATPPLYITADNQIVDGRHRYWCARKLGWKTVPVTIIPDSEIMTLILETLLNRRHYTPGQRAYIVAEHIGEAFEEAKRRMLSGGKDTLGTEFRGSKTPEEYAAEIGVSVRYLRDARAIYEAYKQLPGNRTFTDDEGKKHKEVTARQYFEARIMADEKPIGLGAALAGLGYLIKKEAGERSGREFGGGKPQQAHKQFQLFNKLVSDEETRWEYWQKFDPETKSEHFAAVRTQAAQLPPNICLERAEYHEKLAEQFRKAAKGGDK